MFSTVFFVRVEVFEIIKHKSDMCKFPNLWFRNQRMLDNSYAVKYTHLFFSIFSRNFQVDVPFVEPFGLLISNSILSSHPSFPLLFGSYFSNNLGTVFFCNVMRTVLLQFQYFVQRGFFLQFVFSCRLYFAACCMNLISEAALLNLS